jgi:hypothetical protein
MTKADRIRRAKRGGRVSGEVAEIVGRESLRDRRRREEEQRHAAYLKALEDQRLEAIGKTGKDAKRFQRVVYRALGLDPKAGYEGSPPAFFPDKTLNESSAAAEGQGFRNAVKDPVQRMLRRGEIDDVQYDAANEFIALWEAHSRIGGRAIEYGERVDGGRMPDISVSAMSVVARVDSYRKQVEPNAVLIMEAVCINGRSIRQCCEAEQWGRNPRTVMKKFRAALDETARFFFG